MGKGNDGHSYFFSIIFKFSTSVTVRKIVKIGKKRHDIFIYKILKNLQKLQKLIGELMSKGKIGKCP